MATKTAAQKKRLYQQCIEAWNTQCDSEQKENKKKKEEKREKRERERERDPFETLNKDPVCVFSLSLLEEALKPHYYDAHKVFFCRPFFFVERDRERERRAR